MGGVRLTVCAAPGCSALTRGGYCDSHAAVPVAKRPPVYGKTAARGYGASWRVIRTAYLAKRPWCERCGKPATQVHHRVTKADGGDDRRSNLEALCDGCHADHHDEDRAIPYGVR